MGVGRCVSPARRTPPSGRGICGMVNQSVGQVSHHDIFYLNEFISSFWWWVMDGASPACIISRPQIAESTVGRLVGNNFKSNFSRISFIVFGGG